MTITAQIIADSISPDGIRLTTMQLRYPRFIHAEFMTHRVFSRNASSSRAIPVQRMIEDLRRDPAMPVHWGSNKPGMQAGVEINETVWVQDLQQALPGSPYDQRGEFDGTIEEKTGVTNEDAWIMGMERMIQLADAFLAAGYHKQLVNRILEPWAHINVVVTATEWDNFYELRRHADAQPEIKALADAMWEAQQASEPRLLQPGQWHLPYVTPEDWNNDGWDTGTPALDYLKKVSVARCARVSYLTHDGRPTTIEEDLKLYERLVSSRPLHASPAEHQATPDTRPNIPQLVESDPDIWEVVPSSELWRRPDLHGNFRGWVQYRKTIEQELLASPA